MTDLKPGAVGLAGAIMQNVTHIAPAIAAFFFTQTLVGFAGGTGAAGLSDRLHRS